MALAINPNPYVRTKRTTFSIMMELLIALALVWIAGIIYYFTKGAGTDGLFAILNVVICAVVSFGVEILFFIPKWKKEEGHNFVSLLKKGLNSYGYISGIILALILPVMTNPDALVHIVNLIVTTVVSVGVFKMLFGGFGHNIFNVALVGRIFASLCYGSTFSYGHVPGDKVVEFTSGTVLSNWAGEGWNMLTTFTEENYLLDLLLGNYRGTLGETFTLLILVVGIVLAIRKVIDWKLPVFYIGTCFITSVLVGAVNGANALEFALAQMMTGGLMFGAVFCLTDPVTGPTNNLAKVVYAVFAGFFTMLIRFKGSAPEGVAFAILTANMIGPFIANFYKGRTTTNLVKKYSITGAVCAVMLLVSCAYTGVVENAAPAYANPVVTEVTGAANTYNVKITNEKNAFGNLNMDVTVDAENELVTAVVIYEEGTGSTEGYGLYFFGEGSCHLYSPTQKDKLTNLRATLFTFDNGGVSFDVFKQYDFSYWDRKEYTDFNDLSSDITACGATYTVASYLYGVNAVIDVVEGK